MFPGKKLAAGDNVLFSNAILYFYSKNFQVLVTALYIAFIDRFGNY
jgi:hypothetical protein